MAQLSESRIVSDVLRIGNDTAATKRIDFRFIVTEVTQHLYGVFAVQGRVAARYPSRGFCEKGRAPANNSAPSRSSIACLMVRSVYHCRMLSTNPASSWVIPL